MTRPAKLIDRLLTADPATAVSAILGTVPEPHFEACCCRPDCPNTCTWIGKKGRPPRFCSDSCRSLFFKERARLLDDLDAYERASVHPASSAELAALATRKARLRMLLDRYRPFDACQPDVEAGNERRDQ